jgi:glucose-6-phosphate isomerase
VALAERRGIGVTVLMPYVDRLAPFGLWFRQLWAESLGKDGKGTTPVRALGAVDQHSQLQLYLAGPADKLFTLLVLQQDGQGALLPPDLAGDPALAYLAGRRLGDLLAAEQRATATSLLRHGRPTRVLRLPRLDEASLGALFMHFMLETIIAAALWGVDAFDQPAVEQGKVLARQYLGERARGGAQ